MRSLLLLGLLVALSSIVLGCGDDPSPSEGVFVGTTASGDVFAASIWMDDQVLVYTCGTGASLDGSTAWVIGSPTSRDVELVDGSFSIIATIEENAVRGTFTNASSTEALDLLRISTRADAGLFVTNDGACRTAAVALTDGDAILVQGAHFCAPEGPFFQVTPVVPPETLGDNLLVSFDDGTGVRELELARIEGI